MTTSPFAADRTASEPSRAIIALTWFAVNLVYLALPQPTSIAMRSRSSLRSTSAKYRCQNFSSSGWIIWKAVHS